MTIATIIRTPMGVDVDTGRGPLAQHQRRRRMTRALSLAVDIALAPLTVPAWAATCCVLLWAHRT